MPWSSSYDLFYVSESIAIVRSILLTHKVSSITYVQPIVYMLPREGIINPTRNTIAFFFLLHFLGFEKKNHTAGHLRKKAY